MKGAVVSFRQIDGAVEVSQQGTAIASSGQQVVFGFIFQPFLEFAGLGDIPRIGLARVIPGVSGGDAYSGCLAVFFDETQLVRALLFPSQAHFFQKVDYLAGILIIRPQGRREINFLWRR